MMLSQRIEHTVSLILDWSALQRAAFLVLLLLLQYVQYAVWVLVIWHYPPAHVDIQIELIQRLWPILLGMLLYLLVFYMVLRALQRKIYQPKLVFWLHFLIMLSFALFELYIGYLIGSMSMGAGLLLVGSPILGLLLLDRRAVFAAFPIVLCCAAVVLYATVQGRLPYAPLLTESGLAGGRNGGFWLVSTIFFCLFYIVFLLVVVDSLIRGLNQKNQKIQRISEHDHLTGLLNRRAIERRLQVGFAGDQLRWVSVLLIDLDLFKSFNDRYGHLVGDQILMVCADILRESVRNEDLVSRFGGEEFLVVLFDLTPMELTVIAERIRSSIAAYDFTARLGYPIYVTVSIGAVRQQIHHPQFFAMVARADDALYQAKQRGRNQVVMAAA